MADLAFFSGAPAPAAEPGQNKQPRDWWVFGPRDCLGWFSAGSYHYGTLIAWAHLSGPSLTSVRNRRDMSNAPLMIVKASSCGKNDYCSSSVGRKPGWVALGWDVDRCVSQNFLTKLTSWPPDLHSFACLKPLACPPNRTQRQPQLEIFTNPKLRANSGGADGGPVTPFPSLTAEALAALSSTQEARVGPPLAL